MANTGWFDQAFSVFSEGDGCNSGVPGIADIWPDVSIWCVLRSFYRGLLPSSLPTKPMSPGNENRPSPLPPPIDTLTALDGISDFETEKLLRPPAAVESFVRRVVRGAEFYVGPEQRGEARYAVSLPVAAVPVDKSLRKAGDAFIALTRDISSGGIGMYHTRRVSERLLALEIKSASGEKLRVLAEVLRCNPAGLFYEIGARFVSRLDN